MLQLQPGFLKKIQRLTPAGDRLLIHPDIIIPVPAQNRFITVVQERIRAVALTNQPGHQNRFIQSQLITAGLLTQDRLIEVPDPAADHIQDPVVTDHLTVPVQALLVPGVQDHLVQEALQVQVEVPAADQKEVEDKELIN